MAATAARLESTLHKEWRRAASGGALVRSRSGDVFRVIYPGRPSDGAGPDFRDAVLQAMDGALRRGDVEMHVRASDWKLHGHQTDPRYNGVIFHIVSEGDTDAITAAGVEVPLVILGRLAVPSLPVLDLSPSDAVVVPDNGECASASAAPGPVAGADLLPPVPLGDAGDRRFLAKSSGFQAALRTRGGDDVMWSAVLDGLGYAHNRRGFRTLASRLTWSSLGLACKGLNPAPLEMQQLLSWAAGLTARPRQRDGAVAIAVARLGPLPGSRPEWVRSAGRPANHPSRRVAAAALLAHRWLLSGGPSESLERSLLAALDPRELTKALVVHGEGTDSSYLGPGRASTIVVNAVLPCLHAIAFEAGRWHLAEKCVALYRACPKLPENGIEREARRLLKMAGRPATAATARDQQGLLYLYRALTMR